MTKFVFTCILVLQLVFKSHAQIDTSFWFVAPDVSNTMGDFPITMHFQTYSQPSVIYVRQPANPSGFNTTFTINANTLFSLPLTTSISVIESAPANTVSAKGIYISSKENVSVYYTIGNQTNTNKEMICLKGHRALGTDFYAPIPNSTNVLTYTVPDGGIGFDVVATQTGVTTILITPKANIAGHGKNQTFTKSLTIGQTFSVKDNGAVNPSELSGSIISSDQAIAVTVKGSVISGTNSCPSYFADQITPSNITGMDYVVMKGNSSVDVAYILAPQNATSFTVTNSSSSTTWLINSMETYSVNITNPITYIKTDKPVYVFHVSGYGCKLSGAQLAPAYCAGSYSTAFTRLTTDSLNLSIYTRNGFQSSFSLTSNGTPVSVPATAFSVVPGSSGNLVATRLYLPSTSVPVGSYNLLSNSGDIFGLDVMNGSYTGGSGYSHASDFDIDAFAYANSAPTATICGNTQFTLNGVVGGGPITGQWTILQGYGTLSAGSTSLINNVYTPSLLDTTNNSISIPVNNRYVKIILSTTGICPNVSDTLRLHVKQPPIVSAGASSFICSNNPTVQLIGNVYGATNQGVWSVLAPGSGTFSPNNGTLNPLYLFSSADTTQSQLQFVLTSTNNAGCNPVSDAVTIGINKAPIVKASLINPIIACANNSTLSLNGTVSGTTTSTGIWQSSGSGIFFPNNISLSTNYVPSLNDVTFGSLWLTLESTNNQLCFPTRDSVQVLFTQPAYANAGIDINTCKNNAKALLNGSISGTNTSTGSWLGGAGTFTPSNAALNATYIATPTEVSIGFVTLTLTTSNNGICLGTSDQVKVIFQDKPLANFTVSSVCENQNTEFTDKSVNPTSLSSLNLWTWNFGDSSPISNKNNPSHVYPNAGTYFAKLIVRNSFNCFDTIQRPVLVYALPTPSFEISRACSGSAQLISFKDRSIITSPSTIPATGHYWDFGGYGFSLSKDTGIIFPSEGIYNITHVVTSNFGCQALYSKTITISPRPIAKFIHINNSIAGLGANVSFRDTSLYAVSWTWDFGNGESSDIKYPSTFYKENGTYNVSLTITDAFGCPSTYTSDVKVSTVVSEIIKLIPNVVTPNDDGKNDFWRLDFIDVYFPDAEIEIYNRWGVKIFRSVGYSNAWNGSYKGDPLPVGAYFYTINLHDDNQTPVIKGSVTLIK